MNNPQIHLGKPAWLSHSLNLLENLLIFKPANSLHDVDSTVTA
jgi:hypothetical protein